ncbi:MAG TPA: MFS transporter [Anaerolineaceae bacterium]|nr:MFS transporter [Anaerolineaceae bacterium]
MARPTKLMNRNFTLLFIGQTINSLGSQGFAIAMLFWVKHETESATLMGMLMMFSSLPAILLGPLGGVFADRHSRRLIIILSDAIRGISVVTLVIWMILRPEPLTPLLIWLFVVSTMVNTVGSFFTPAIIAAVPDIAPEERVNTANSLMQVSFQLSTLIGQGIGGTVFRILGAPILFLINGVGYLLAAVLEVFITIPQVIPTEVPGCKKALNQYLLDTREGIRYVRGRPGLRNLVLISALINFFTVPVIMLLPFYVEDVLRVYVDWYGYLIAIYGVGALIGYVISGAGRFSARITGNLMLGFMVLESISQGALGLTNMVQWAMALVFLGGIFSGYVTVILTTVLQLRTPKEIRGRVYSLLSTIAGAITPIAMGLSGVIADLANHNIGLIYLVSGAIMTLLSCWIATDRAFREFLFSPPPADLDSSVQSEAEIATVREPVIAPEVVREER